MYFKYNNLLKHWTNYILEMLCSFYQDIIRQNNEATKVIPGTSSLKINFIESDITCMCVYVYMFFQFALSLENYVISSLCVYIFLLVFMHYREALPLGFIIKQFSGIKCIHITYVKCPGCPAHAYILCRFVLYLQCTFFLLS